MIIFVAFYILTPSETFGFQILNHLITKICKVKGLPKEELEARNDLVLTIKERIEAIPDGASNGATKPTEGWTASTSSYTGIKFDSTSGNPFVSFIDQSLCR